MEQLHQPSGGSNEITDHSQAHDPNQSHDRELHQDEQGHHHEPHHDERQPPLTFAEAVQRNGYSLLLELHDHASQVVIGAEQAQARQHHLGELALSAAVVSWWSRWQPLTMHKAFVAGATAAEVAAATGLTEAEAYHMWETWADWQVYDLFPDQPLLDPTQVGNIKVRLRRDDLT